MEQCEQPQQLGRTHKQQLQGRSGAVWATGGDAALTRTPGSGDSCLTGLLVGRMFYAAAGIMGPCCPVVTHLVLSQLTVCARQQGALSAPRSVGNLCAAAACQTQHAAASQCSMQSAGGWS